MKRNKLKYIISLVLCAVLLASAAAPAYATEADEIFSFLDESSQELTDGAENLDPSSRNSVQAYSDMLNSWDLNSQMTSVEQILASLEGSPTGSVQFIFAQLQLQQAQLVKNQAEEYTKQIEELQKKQEEIADLISDLRKFSSTCITTPSLMPEDLVDDLKNTEGMSNALKEKDAKTGEFKDIDFTTKKFTSAEVDNLIKSACDVQESLGEQTRTDMVYLQDFISQYNSYLQNANAVIKDNSDLYAGLSGSPSVGGTMLGGSAGMLVTGILLGACAGGGLTFAVMRFRKRKSS